MCYLYRRTRLEQSTGYGSVNGIVFFGEVNDTRVQGGVLLPGQLLQASRHEHHIDRRAPLSSATHGPSGMMTSQPQHLLSRKGAP